MYKKWRDAIKTHWSFEFSLRIYIWINRYFTRIFLVFYQNVVQYKHNAVWKLFFEELFRLLMTLFNRWILTLFMVLKGSYWISLCKINSRLCSYLSLFLLLIILIWSMIFFLVANIKIRCILKQFPFLLFIDKTTREMYVPTSIFCISSYFLKTYKDWINTL